MTRKQPPDTEYVLGMGAVAFGVIALILAVCLFLAGQVIDNQQERIDLLNAEIRAATERRERAADIAPATAAVQPEATGAAMPWPERDRPWNTIHNCTVTAYCACERCCGRWADGLTASGATPTEGVTVAVDTSVIPLGAEVRFEGDDTVYIAQDTGVAGSHIDRYFNDHAEAEDFGVQYKTVYWRERT